jgi:hypothetical protein
MNTQKMNTSALTKGASNYAKKGMNTYKESSTMGKVIFFIVLVLFLAFLIYLIYAAVKVSNINSTNNPIIINDVIDAYVARPAFQLPQLSQGMNHTFSTWIYVKDWNYNFGQYKNILWKGTPHNSTDSTKPTIHSPSIWLYPLTNSLKVITSSTVPEKVESCDIQNVPLMTWVHITYVLNNRTVDIYINGKLERSCALKGIPILSADPVYMTTGSPNAGYYGKIGKTQYFTKALLPNEVANIYQQGPLGTSQFQIQFFKNGKFISFDRNTSFSDNNS